MATVTIDSYSESNRSQELVMFYDSPSNFRTHAAQSFTCTYGITLHSCKFYLKKLGSYVETKSIYAKVYSHTGAYGTSSLPGSLLATSDAVTVSSLSTSLSLITFSFSGTNQITLSPNTYYVLDFDYTTATATDDYVQISYDYTSSSHSGNISDYGDGSWAATSGNDLCFYIYGSSTTPAVTTENCSNIAYNSATGNGNITASGGVTVTRRGFCYKEGTSGDPTTSDSTVYDDGTYNTGAYTKGITGLSAATDYRVRAYAVNAEGTSYGTTVQLTTSAVDGPVVTTTTTSLLMKTYVRFGGEVTDEGDQSVTERGVYYGTDEFTQSTKLTSTSGIGAFTIFLTGLTADTTYYFKAFATSSVSTSYGDVLSFTTGADTPVEGEVYYLPPFKN